MSSNGHAAELLGCIADISIGRTPPRKDPRYWTSDLDRPFCTITDMNGRLISPTREGVTALAEDEGKAKRVAAGSLLMSFKLTIGRVGFAAVDLFPNEAIACVTPIREDLDARYLAYCLETFDYTALAGEAAKGGTLNKDSLKKIEVAIPTPDEQLEVIGLIDAMDTTREAAVAYLEGLSAARNAVLVSLLAGEPVELPGA